MSQPNPQPNTSSKSKDQSRLIPTEAPLVSISLNYIQLLNWFWDEVPDMPGYKPHYGFAFMAIVDCINRNSRKEMWRETAVDYDRLFNKIGFSKTIYYEALKWLNDHHLITYKAGRNRNSVARFHIGSLPVSEVQKRTADHTSTPFPEVQKRTADHTSGYTSSGPINKNKPITLKPSTNHTPVVPTFEEFWDLYDRKVGSKKKTKSKWKALPDEEKSKIMMVLPGHIQATPDKQYRMYPLTFLNGECWKDEDIGKSLTPVPSSSHSKPVAAPRPVPQTNIR